MASDRYSISSGTIALPAASTRTIILLNPAVSEVAITELWVGFDMSAANLGCAVQLYRTTTLGTPTGTTATIVKENPSSSASQSSGLTNLSAEPTAIEIMRDVYIPPNGGAVIIEFPLGREPTGAAAGQRIGVRIITQSGVSPDVRSTIVWEE